MKKIASSSASARSEKNIVRIFAGYLVLSVALFLFLISILLFPQIRSTLTDLQTESDVASSNSYANILHRCVEDREYALLDIAQSPFIFNAVLLSQGNRPDFRDYVRYANLLREDPELTVVDINGDIMFSEADTDRDYSWVLDLIEGDLEHILNLVPDETNPLFELAVPIVYGNGREGALIARFSADPEAIFNIYGGLSDVSGVVLRDGANVIQSDISVIAEQHIERHPVERYDISIDHVTSRVTVYQKNRALIFKFLISAVGAAVLAFTFLLAYGRRLIVEPYVELSRSQQAIAKAVEGISRIDPNGCYTEINSAYAGAAGYRPEELLGKNWSVTVYPDDLDMLNSAYADMLDKGQVTAEARGRKKDGSIFFKQVTMISEYDKKGVFVGHHCFMKDITERKQAELYREALVEKLSESNEELERFAFVCSHDLQEPLRMIRSFSGKLEEHLEDRLQGDEKGKKYFYFVKNGAMRAQELIRDILAYSSINSDTHNLEDVEFDNLVALLQTTLEATSEGATKSITADPLPMIKGNKTQLYQLLQNLTNNGLKYQAPGNDAKVHIGVEELDGLWKISVKDNGIGMAERHWGKIFEVFKRLHRNTEFAGTGVGLSICRKIVERHGGKIWVESVEGEGSTFYFTLNKSHIEEKADENWRQAS